MSEITAEKIKEAVLAEDDFGHEMRVGGLLKNFPQADPPEVRIMNPLHGGTYNDPSTGKSRQFDYRVEIIRGFSNTRNVWLAIECKNLNPESPLVICGRGRDAHESRHVYIDRDSKGYTKIHQSSQFISLFQRQSFVGKNLLRLKKFKTKEKSELGARVDKTKFEAAGDQDVYDRYAQALASSHELVTKVLIGEPNTSSFVMPIVVVPNRSLWIVEYDDSGTGTNPVPVDSCDFYVDHKFNFNMPIGASLNSTLTYTIPHVRFVTMDGLSAMLVQFAKSDSLLWHRIFN